MDEIKPVENTETNGYDLPTEADEIVKEEN